MIKVSFREISLVLLAAYTFYKCPVYAQSSPNSQSPAAVLLVDPSTGNSYSAGGSDANSILPIANFDSPLSVILIDPTTGSPYKATGGGSGTVNSGTAGQVATYSSTGTTVSGETTITAAQSPAISGDVTKAAGSASATVTGINGGTVPTSANCMSTNGSAQPVAGCPAPNRTAASPTVLASDMGGTLNVSSGTLTIPAIGSGVFPANSTLLVVNYSGSILPVTTTPTINSGGGCVSGTGIPTGASWQLSSNGTTLDCAQFLSSATSSTHITPIEWTFGTIAQATTAYTAVAQEGGIATENISPMSGTIKNLYVRTSSLPAAGQTFTATVYIGTIGSPASTIITCQITSSSSNNLCSDTTDTASISTGQAWTVQIVTSATSGSTGTSMATIEFDH